MASTMMIKPFATQSFEQKVVFGRPYDEALPEMLDGLGVGTVMVVSTGAAGAALAERLGARAVAVFGTAKMHTPVAVTEAAMAAFRASGADGVVSIGGGSAVGLGKALAQRAGIMHVAIPTTYAGSEMTPVLGQTEHGRKVTLRDKRVVPQGVIYDVGLSVGLPVGISMTSGLNALAHAVEALYAPDRTRFSDMVAGEAITTLLHALPLVHGAPDDFPARTEMLYGAWFAGQALAMTTMGLHHKLAHVLGGMLDLPHAPMHAALLPHVVAFNEVAAGETLAPLRLALACMDAGQGLAELGQRLGAPQSLGVLGMTDADIGPAVAAVLAGGVANPRGLDVAGLTALLRGAVSGRIDRSV